MSESTFARLTDAFADVVLPLAGSGARRRLVAVVGEPPVFWRVAGGKAVRLPERTRPKAGSDVEVRLPEGAVLRRTVRLPAAGREYFPAILEHRLDRLTPWRPDQVVFGFRAGEEADADGQVPVELFAASRAVADDVDVKLAARKLRPVSLGPDGEPLDRPASVDLWRGARDPRRRRVRRAVVGAGLAAFAVLAPACAGSFLYVMRAEGRLAAVEERAAAARRQLIGASGTGVDRERATALLADKTPEKAAVVLVDKIAAALPDNTVLERLEVTEATVRMAGTSGNAPALIGLLDAVEGIDEVRFAAPVTRDASGAAVFEISAARQSGKQKS